MTNPNDPQDADYRATLPADLQSLDRELSAIRIEERPSFRPELEKELAEVWRKRSRSGTQASRGWIRILIAAGLAGLMIAGVSVPSARAAVAQLVRSVAAEAFSGFFAPEEEPEVALPEIQAQEPPPEVPESRTEVVVSPVDPSREVEPSIPEVPASPIMEITFPGIASRQEAARIIASHYPSDLQEAGVEGTVLLRFYVDAQGNAENMSLGASSGNRRLDYAAMRAAREVTFRPATRNGVPVGTLVEVQIHFFALSGAGIIGADTMGSGG